MMIAFPIPRRDYDCLSVVFTAQHPENVEVYGMETMRAVKFSLEIVGLALSDEKEETVLRTNCREKNTTKVKIGRYTVVSKAATKYLGVMIDVN